MQNPPLTRPEVAAVFRGEVGRLIARGMGRTAAIKTVAERYDIDPEWVAELVSFADGLAGGEA
jgi:hypothetical protein